MWVQDQSRRRVGRNKNRKPVLKMCILFYLCLIVVVIIGIKDVVYFFAWGLTICPSCWTPICSHGSSGTRELLVKGGCDGGRAKHVFWDLQGQNKCNVIIECKSMAYILEMKVDLFWQLWWKLFILLPDGSNVLGAEETNFDRGYVKKKLEHGLSRIWQVGFGLAKCLYPVTSANIEIICPKYQRIFSNMP